MMFDMMIEPGIMLMIYRDLEGKNFKTLVHFITLPRKNFGRTQG